jgi:lipoprotein-releasing system permease protein
MRLSVTATVISVAVMIIAIAFAGGFQRTISHKIFSFFGHIRVQDYNNVMQNSLSEELPIRKNDSVYRLPKVDPSIRKVQAYATRNAVLKSKESIEGILLKGVDTNYDFNALQPFLVSGRWIHFNDSSYSTEINLSESIARTLHLKVNDPLLLYFIQPNGEIPRVRKMTVAGIYKTGIEEYDKVFAIGDLKLVQRLNNWDDNQIGGYEIFLSDPNRMEEVSNRIFPYLPIGNVSQTIKEIIPSLFDWLALQSKTILMVLLIMIVIAVLNLVTCLLILVLERTRMIGLLKSLGAPGMLVQRIFLYQGAFITMVGIGAGTLAGLLLCLLQDRLGIIRLPEESYYISRAEVFITGWQVMAVMTGCFVVCMLVLLLPVMIVKKIIPVKAIQFR